MTGTSKNKKNLPESIIEELKELRELILETKNKATSLEMQITNNHSELLEKK